MTNFMLCALNQAKKALLQNEVPIGAVVVKDGQVIGRGYNKRQKTKNPLDHAELIAIKQASKKIGDWRLDGCQIYVTLQPCPMCAGAIANARIQKLVFGAYDKNDKDNMYETILSGKYLNHKTEIEGGVLQQQCSELLTNFFSQKR